MPFDWVRTPIESLPKILACDFSDFLCNCEMVDGPNGRRPILRDSQYGLTLLHDEAIFKQGGARAVREFYTSRIERFRSAVKSNQRIVFVRGRAGVEEVTAIEDAIRRLYPRLDFFVLGVRERGQIVSRGVEVHGRIAAALGPTPPDWRGCAITWAMATSRVTRVWRLSAAEHRARRPASYQHGGPTLASYIAELRAVADSVQSLIQDNADAVGQVPAYLISALIAAEDHRYRRHLGVDPIAVVRALVGKALGRKWGGGSTIEQQLYRTLSGRRELTLRRKLREMVGATVLSTRFRKDDLVFVYLLIAYYGSDMNGLSQVIHTLGLNLQALTPLDAAGIIARLKYPQPRSAEVERMAQIERRKNYILERMTE